MNTIGKAWTNGYDEGERRSKREDPMKLLHICPHIMCSTLPWLITYGIFTFNHMDPEHCWVSEGEFAAFPERTFGQGERDYAVLFQKWVTVTFWTCVVTFFLPFLMASLFCCYPFTMPANIILTSIYFTNSLVRFSYWIWLVALRLSHEGSVASGKLI